ncbi:hypothetical protein [Tateyamaria sp. Alg231-49]|uniref:hypothetical protein n=1 Tax=Tateyamaria sp. Alg231-49 TaxID=1922219 RepID=UPI000D55F274|nr:hypothetical protein [Tateyamaria sp. Alg231-49]
MRTDHIELTTEALLKQAIDLRDEWRSKDLNWRNDQEEIVQQTFCLAMLNGAKPTRRNWAQHSSHVEFFQHDCRILTQFVNSVPGVADAWDHPAFFAKNRRTAGVVLQPYNTGALPIDGHNEFATWRRLDHLSWWWPPHTCLLLIEPLDLATQKHGTYQLSNWARQTKKHKRKTGPKRSGVARTSPRSATIIDLAEYRKGKQ